VGKLTRLQVVSTGESEHLQALARFDPALLPRLVARWRDWLTRAGEKRDDLTTESPALTGLVSKASGDRFLERGPAEPGRAEMQLVKWVDLLALMPGGNGLTADGRR
jgi:hypothetical protein